MRQAVIVGAARTAIGSFGGALSTVPAPRLGAVAIREALKRSGVAPEKVDEVMMGCVLSGGIGQAPARQAAIYAGVPDSVPCLTVSKVCGSGLKSVMLAAQAIRCGDADCVVAGGMENMSLAPYILEKARTGYRMGDGKVVDMMVKDGLWDPYNNFHMGMAAEMCAKEHGITREMQDEFAVGSYTKSLGAIKDGAFKDEIAPVPVPQRKGDPIMVEVDEEPGRGNVAKIPKLRPAFDREGTVTAANASSINDGAAAVVLMSAEAAQAAGLKPLAVIVGSAQHAQEPAWFTTAPAFAIEKLLKKTGKAKEDIDLYEINEAFAVVSLAVNKLLGLDGSNVNVNGGAVSMGHPIGASGTRILVTLLYAMQARGSSSGVASLCIGGGEAVAMMVERG
ncbi:MAG: acetyl-CoA C-acetyltransferase [Deltaproteobacteria bacterium]|nr:acetyl-CoA C-acetyltransferase [Deltaproteobacteria bacterium]